MLNYFDQLDNKISRYKKVYTNKPKVAMSHLIMWNLKQMLKNWKSSTIERDTYKCTENSKSILFNLQGGLGDLLISLNYLMQLKQKNCKDIDFYITVPSEFFGSIKSLLEGYSFVNVVVANMDLQKYLAIIDLCRAPIIRFVEWDFVKKRYKNLYKWLEEVKKFNNDYPEYFKPGTVGDYLFTKFSLMNGRNRVSQADIDGSLKISGKFKIKTALIPNFLNSIKLVEDEYITLQCGTGIYSWGVLTTREWKPDYFNKLIELLKHKYPKLKIVQLGNSKDIKLNADIDLRGKTNFVEFLTCLNGAKLHIGGEAGPIHLRHFLNRKTSVVLFGPTDKSFYGYPENINISSNICPGCEWLHSYWYKRCALSGKEAVCLNSIKPDFVFNQVCNFLTGGKYAKTKN